MTESRKSSLPPSLSRNFRQDATGGLLMSMIQTLSATRDPDDLAQERAKLENDFAQCDRKLGDLVAEHKKDIYQVVDLVDKTLHRFDQTKCKLRETRQRLQAALFAIAYCQMPKELKQIGREVLQDRQLLDMMEQDAGIK